MRRLVAVVAGMAGLLLLWAPAAGAEPAAAEAEFVARVNALRASKGLVPLTVDLQLTEVARQWSAKMAAAGALSHNPNLPNQVTNWKLVGENVGVGPTVEMIEQAFENSPAHYANLVKPEYQNIGVGVVEKGSQIWVTQNFKTPKTAVAAPDTAPAPAPGPAPGPRAAAPPRPKPAPAPAAARAQARPAPAGPATTVAPVPPIEAEVEGVQEFAPPTPSAAPASPAAGGRALLEPLPITALALLALVAAAAARRWRRRGAS